MKFKQSFSFNEWLKKRDPLLHEQVNESWRANAAAALMGLGSSMGLVNAQSPTPTVNQVNQQEDKPEYYHKQDSTDTSRDKGLKEIYIPKKHKYYPNSVFYVNSGNEVLMEYSPINKYIHIHHEYIWSKIESLFHLNYLQVESIMKAWLKEKPYELGEVTPSAFVVSPLTSWKRIKNLN
jgi:hypothetical protein